MSYQYSYGPGGGGGGSGGYRPPPPQQQGGGYGSQPPQHYQQQQQQQQQPSYGGGYGGGGGGGCQGNYGNYGTYGSHRPQAYTSSTGPPPGVDRQLWNWFIAVDRNGNGYINSIELQQALVNGDWTPFSQECIKILMNMFDTDKSGTITFNEFVGLWNYIQDWQKVFRYFDTDRSGTIEENELQRALSNFGYNLNPRLLHLISHRFVKPSEGAAGPRGSITFDGFVQCCVTVKTLTEHFVRRDPQRTGRITVSYDEFMDISLSTP